MDKSKVRGMNRQERLKSCEKCQLRKMDMKKGLLCSLTMKYADFQEKCPDYKADTVRKKEINQISNNELILEEIAEVPKKYWNRLGYYLLAVVAIFFISSIIRMDFLKGNNDSNKVILYFYILLHSFPLWFFIGWELKNIKTGTITGIIAFVIGVLSFEFEMFRAAFISYIISVLPIMYFGLSTLKNKKKIGKFVLFSFIAISGVTVFSHYDGLGLSKAINQIINLVYDKGNHISMGLFNIQKESQEYMYSVLSLKHEFFDLFNKLMVFIVITFTYKYLQGDLKWKLNLITLGRKETTNKMILYVFVFYTSIGFLSLGILGMVIDFLKRLTGRSWEYQGFPKIGYDDYLVLAVSFFSGILLLVFVVSLYRKILLEYYLEKGKQIGWNFYFGQMPVIGVFVWINNFFTLKKTIRINKTNIRERSKRQNGLVIALIFFSIVYLLIKVNFLIHLDSIDIIYPLLSTLMYIFYLKNKDGIYLVSIVTIVSLFVFIYLGFSGVNLPSNLISGSVFWTLAFYFLVYPVFFLHTFKIQIPKNRNEEEE